MPRNFEEATVELGYRQGLVVAAGLAGLVEADGAEGAVPPEMDLEEVLEVEREVRQALLIPQRAPGAE